MYKIIDMEKDKLYLEQLSFLDDHQEDDEIKGDLKLEDLFPVIETGQTVRFDMNNGESFCPKISDLDSYKDYFVTDIFAHNSNLVIKLSDSI